MLYTPSASASRHTSPYADADHRMRHERIMEDRARAYSTPEDDLGWQFAPVGYRTMPRRDLVSMALGTMTTAMMPHYVASAILGFLALVFVPFADMDAPQYSSMMIVMLLGSLVFLRSIRIYFKSYASYRRFYALS